jgi:hypothetical protein
MFQITKYANFVGFIFFLACLVRTNAWRLYYIDKKQIFKDQQVQIIKENEVNVTRCFCRRSLWQLLCSLNIATAAI